MTATLEQPRTAVRTETESAASWRRWLALPVILTGTFMITLDFFIVNVAVPAMQGDLVATSAAIEWVVAGYGLAFAAGLILGGRLGDPLRAPPDVRGGPRAVHARLAGLRHRAEL